MIPHFVLQCQKDEDAGILICNASLALIIHTLFMICILYIASCLKGFTGPSFTNLAERERRI